MEKENTRHISSWKQLLQLVDSVNPHKYALVLTGWIFTINGDRTRIKSLVFATKPVDILLSEKDIDKKRIDKEKIKEEMDSIYYKLPSAERGYCENFFYKIKQKLGIE